MNNNNKQINTYRFKDNQKRKIISIEGHLDYKPGWGYDTFERISTKIYLTSITAFNLNEAAIRNE